MPVYTYRCQLCDREITAEVPYGQRLDSQVCDCGGKAEYRVSAPAVHGEVKRGDNRLIFDERQVSSERGEHWREQGTTGQPGGAGRTLTFDQGKR